MPIIDAFPGGTPVWADLQSSNPTGASAFYSDLFGWAVAAPADGQSGGYAIATLGATPVSAIGPLPPMSAEAGGRSTWTVYFAVDDIERAAAATAQFGGQVMLPPGEIMPGIQLAIVADPQGAVFGLWQQSQGSPWLREEPGAVDWVELVESGYEASLEFYENVLGVSVSQMHMSDGVYTLFDVGESSVAGVDGVHTGDAPAHWLVYIRVADLDASLARLRELGGQVVADGAADPQVGRWAVVADPFDGAFALLEPPVREA